jgi:SET domain-containing protein
LKDGCRNKSAQRGHFPAARKLRSPQVRRCRVGRGVFARRYYAAGEVIGEILGTVIAGPDYSSPYCYSMGDDRTLEPDAPFRFLNHSCQPNSRFQWYDLQASASGAIERRVFVLALDAIRPGDEFTIDYCWPPEMAIPCLCGAANCRGWVIDLEDLAEFLATRPSSAE